MQKNKKRADGRIQAKVYIGNINGKKQYKYVYGKSQKEIDKKVLEIKLSLKKGIDVMAERDTFNDWMNKWLEYKKVDVSHGKYISYKSKLDKLQDIFNIPIIKIRTSDIQSIFIDLSTQPNKRTGRPYAKESLKELKMATSAVFQLAIENRILDYNPANVVKIPNTIEGVKRRALTSEEQQWIIDTTHRAQRAAMIMMYAGLRRGELIPLTWNDIDLKNGTITINKSVEFINGKPIIKDTAKSEKSIRTVYIPEVLINFISSEKKTGLLVCPSTKGKLMSDSAWRSFWESYLTDLNLKYGNFSNNIKTKGKKPKSKFAPEKADFTIPRITAHWLRHTFITLMYLSGIDILTAKEQAGHADIKTTMEIYTHLDNEYKHKSMLKLNDYLSDNNKISDISDVN